MNDTPRTDELVNTIAIDPFEGETQALIDFARQLERELAEAKKDSERLDWLDKQGCCGIGHISYGDYRYYFGEEFPPVREAIDAARK